MTAQLELIAPVLGHCTNCDPRWDAHNMQILLSTSVGHLQEIVARGQCEMNLSKCSPTRVLAEQWHMQHRHDLFVSALRRKLAGDKPEKAGRTIAQDRADRVPCRMGCGKKVHRGGDECCAHCLMAERQRLKIAGASP